jgi:hypothetical protein
MRLITEVAPRTIEWVDASGHPIKTLSPHIESSDAVAFILARALEAISTTEKKIGVEGHKI